MQSWFHPGISPSRSCRCLFVLEEKSINMQKPGKMVQPRKGHPGARKIKAESQTMETLETQSGPTRGVQQLTHSAAYVVSGHGYWWKHSIPADLDCCIKRRNGHRRPTHTHTATQPVTATGE